MKIILGNNYVAYTLRAALVEQNTPVTHITETSLIGILSYLDEAIRLPTDQARVIINCAEYNYMSCMTAPDYDKAAELNFVLPTNLAILCKNSNIGLIHISTSDIFNSSIKIFTEEDRPNYGAYSADSNLYCRTKHTGDMVLETIKVGCLIRPGILFGPIVNDENYLNIFHKTKELFSADNSYVNVKDLCGFIIKFIGLQLHNTFGIYNVANEGPVSTQALAACFYTANKSNPYWCYVQATANKDMGFIKTQNRVLNTTKIRNLGLGLPSAYPSINYCIQYCIANESLQKKSSV